MLCTPPDLPVYLYRLGILASLYCYVLAEIPCLPLIEVHIANSYRCVGSTCKATCGYSLHHCVLVSLDLRCLIVPYNWICQ